MVPPMTPGSARDVALSAIRRAREGDTFLRDALHQLLDASDLEPRDRALATALASGVVRHRRTLRQVISHVRGEGHRAGSIQPELLPILELATFQLLFLDRVPAYAAVSEAVDAAGRTVARKARKKVAGFANGVLRGVQRLIVGHESTGEPARDALPHPDGGVVRLTEPVLPDPTEDRACFLGAAFSLPDWLVERWLAAYGEKTDRICRANNRRPRVFGRVNRRKIDPEALISHLAEEELVVRRGPRPGSVDLSELPNEMLQNLAASGLVTVQDPAAMAAVELLDPRPEQRVLDFCASPGTKTTQIVEAMGDTGRVVACDVSEEKLEPIRRTTGDRVIASVETCVSTEVSPLVPAGGFDAALVDAPCSNTGVLARRVEARWRAKPDNVAELAEMQRGLLELATALVRPGGRLAYSTCSLLPEENDEVVAEFLTHHRDWTRAKREQLLPGPNQDGAFAALLVRKG